MAFLSFGLKRALGLDLIGHYIYTVKSRFNECRFNVKFRYKSRYIASQFNIKSRFKLQNLVTEMKFRIKKSLFSLKSRFKESKCADRGHLLT